MTGKCKINFFIEHLAILFWNIAGLHQADPSKKDVMILSKILTQNANCRSYFRVLTYIVIRWFGKNNIFSTFCYLKNKYILRTAKQLKWAVRCLQCLPVNVVEVQIEDTWILSTLFGVFAVCLCLNRFIFCPISDRKRWKLLFDISYELFVVDSYCERILVEQLTFERFYGYTSPIS